MKRTCFGCRALDLDWCNLGYRNRRGWQVERWSIGKGGKETMVIVQDSEKCGTCGKPAIVMMGNGMTKVASCREHISYFKSRGYEVRYIIRDRDEISKL